MANIIHTVPGYTAQSNNFMVKFISGFKDGKLNEEVEYQNDWTKVMDIILDNLETFPTRIMNTHKFLVMDLNRWTISQPWGKYGSINTNVTIEEKAYFTPPLGSTKSFRISFSESFELLFSAIV